MPGENIERWDGMDISKAINLAKHPEIKIDIQSYTLSKNSIMFGNKATETKFINIKWSKEQRKRKKVLNKRMVAMQQQAPETRGDYEVKLNLPAGLSKSKTNVPIVNGVIPVLLTVPKSNLAVALDRRVEPVFYIDGQFAYENEVGFLPMTWLINTNDLNDGEHYITVNVRGYEGNFGMATKKIHVIKNSLKAKQQK
jgi:hypothetical protein